MPSICFVGTDNYPVLNPAYGHEYFGGESVQQTLLARAYAAAGWSVHMLVKDHGQPDDEVIDGIRVHKAYAQEAGLPVLRFVHPRLTGILRALAAADADVYYQSCAGMMTGVVAWFCRRQSRRFVFRVAHDTDCIPGQQLIQYWRDRRIYEYGLRRADFISTQGRHQSALLEQHYGLSSTPVNMTVEVPRSEEAERDIDILWVNNFRDFKRPDLAVELARRLPHRRMVMIGGAVPGSERLYRDIAEAASDLGNLEITGAVPYHQVNRFFSRSRLFVNTSDSEGFPNSFLQAWIRGVPVVSFFDPDGLIVRHGLGESPADLDQMVARIDALLADPTALEESAQRARRYVQAHYAPDAVLQRHVTLGATPYPERAVAGA